jgi:KamA family protein
MGTGHRSTAPPRPLAARRASYVDRVEALTAIPPAERVRLARVTERYTFRVNDYYLSLIDWKDPDDPIRQLVIPRVEELDGRDALDISNEHRTTVAHGVEHKFPDTVVILCNDTCGAFCRYCNRKRLFMAENDEVARDLEAAVEYVAARPEVTDVLLTGGDPLLMSTRRLATLLGALRAIPHVRAIRIGTKIPAFDPQRIVGDDELHAVLRAHSSGERRIYLMTHFDHPRELTDLAVAAIASCIDDGVVCANQCPIIRGVNDDAGVLAALFARLAFIGCPQYYVFQCAPTAGNEPFEVPLAEGWRIFRDAMARGSGLARRGRYVMSHATGKIEILGFDERCCYLRYLRAVDPADHGRVLVRRRDDAARWLDELRPLDGDPTS